MKGLAKIANEQVVNLNTSSREDRLLDELEAAREYIAELEGQRNPEVEARADAALGKHSLIGTGIGAGIGGLLGGRAGYKSGGGLSSTALGGLGGAAIGGIYGLVPGAISGAIKAEGIRANEEDPELLKRLEAAALAEQQAEGKLERHYLTADRIRQKEEERLQARRDLLGY